MASQFLTPDWYRVAGLRPVVLGHAQVSRHRYGRHAWYTLHDPLSGRVHRLTPSAYLFAARMDGRRTVDAIWQELVTELDVHAPGQQAVVQLLVQLHGADLLGGDIPPDAAELLTRRDRLARSLWVRNLRSPLSIQVPLINPDRFLTRSLPAVSWLISWAGLFAWVLLVGAGVLTAAQHWAELSENVADRVLAGEGLLVMALCYPVIKIVHELGHGYVAKRLGCEVREMGVMLLVLFPVPYVEASASAALRSKWQRAGVAAAGIMVELALAAIATLVWASAEPGLIRAVAFNVMIVGGLSTLVVNGNPLLRFDGYYVMSDVLEVPNLGQRSTRYLGHLMNRYVYGVPGIRDFSATTYERCVMAVYAPVAWCYRMIVLTGVAVFVAMHYFVLGVIAAAVSAVTGIGLPLVKALWRVATGTLYRSCRGRAAGITFGAIAVVAALVLVMPAPLHSTAEGVIWLPEDAAVRARGDGFIRSVDARPGSQVEPGRTLFTLEHPVAVARLRVSEAKVEELEAKYAAEWVTDRVAAGVTEFELKQERAAYMREQDRVGQHDVIAPAAGRFNAVRPAASMLGRFVREGEVIGYVTPAAGQVARVLVPQTDIGLVNHRLIGVAVRLADRRTDLPSAIVRALPGGRDDLPSQALSTANGGQVSADPRDPKGQRAFERLFQFDVSLPPDVAVADSGFGSRVYVRFDYVWEPVGEMVYRRIRQGLLSRFAT